MNFPFEMVTFQVTWGGGILGCCFFEHMLWRFCLHILQDIQDSAIGSRAPTFCWSQGCGLDGRLHRSGQTLFWLANLFIKDILIHFGRLPILNATWMPSFLPEEVVFLSSLWPGSKCRFGLGWHWSRKKTIHPLSTLRGIVPTTLGANPSVFPHHCRNPYVQYQIHLQMLHFLLVLC